MRLIACSRCHRQYDVTHVAQESFACRCGESVENRRLCAVDAEIHRCGSCGAIVQAEAEDCSFCGSAIVRDAGRLSLICPECFARNAEDSRFCTACGIGFQPEAVPLDGDELPCPSCGGLMPVRAVGGVAVNECPGCHGVWAPGESFAELVRRSAKARQAQTTLDVGIAPRSGGANPAAQEVAYRKCPVCEAFMHRKNYGRSSGVIVDSCHKHGTWLDADELEQIAGFILSGRAELKTVVDREHAEAQEAATVAAFQSAVAQHGDSFFSARVGSGGTRWVKTILDLLDVIIR